MESDVVAYLGAHCRYHFSSGAYVEYVGAITAPDREALLAKVNEEFQRLVKVIGPPPQKNPQIPVSHFLV